MTRVEELAGNAALVLFPNFPAGQRDTPTAVIAEAIRQALTEALGPSDMAMIRAVHAPSDSDLPFGEEAAEVWRLMAAVRLRDVLSGAKE